MENTLDERHTYYMRCHKGLLYTFIKRRTAPKNYFFVADRSTPGVEYFITVFPIIVSVQSE